MVKKIHFRLTFLCTAMTGCLCLIMTIFYLLVSERNLRENDFLSFQNEMNPIISGLENTSVITDYYLSSLEAGGRYYAFVEDNGMPLLHGSIVENEQQQEKQKLLAEVKAYFSAHYKIGTSQDLSSLAGPLSAFHTEFIYEPPRRPILPKTTYYVCAAALPKQQGGLSVYIIAPTRTFYRRLVRQRITFAAANLGTLILLYLFFYGLTGYLLCPIEENQKKQGSFVASASHELRTPLSVILSSASLIPGCTDAEREQLCSTITQEGAAMKRLLDEMLLLAGTDSHTLRISKTEAELDTLILDSVETFEPLAKEKALRLTAELPSVNLPPCLCDRERIGQVLSILIHNAISYTPEGGRITVSLSVPAKGHFTIRVKDTGIGIADEDKERIFERFYRADTSHSQKEHFGLGLCIAREIIEEHGGSLAVTDTPGGGATFLVRL